MVDIFDCCPSATFLVLVEHLDVLLVGHLDNLVLDLLIVVLETQ